MDVDLNHRLVRSFDRTTQRRAGARALGALTLAVTLAVTGGELAAAQPSATTSTAATTTPSTTASATSSTTTTTQSIPQVRSVGTHPESGTGQSPQVGGTSVAAATDPAQVRATSTTTPSPTAATSTSATAPTTAAEQARPGNGKKIPYTGELTENPNATVVPGKMRSDREEIPSDFTKADADRAETMEAQLIQQKSGRGAALLASCQVYWPSPFQVCDAIKDKYKSLGGPGSFLSFPSSGNITNPDGVGQRVTFLNGPIYWSPAGGAHPVVNSFLNRWGIHQYEAGWLGYPITGSSRIRVR